MSWRRALVLAILTLFTTGVMGVSSAQAAPADTAGAATVTTQKLDSTVSLAAADACPNGYSCYYAYRNGVGKIWTAPSCGFFDLGRFLPPLNDRISSIVNLGGGFVQPLNWTGASWVNVGPRVPVGSLANYYGSYDNVIDAVIISC